VIHVSVTNQCDSTRADKPLMRSATETVLKGERVAAAKISLAFVDDATSERINRQFLDHEGPTDIITFPLGSKPLQGELIIGAEVAGRVAAERGHDVQHELALYVVHGLLHLCGYDDKKPAPLRLMRQREAHYLQLLGLPAISEPCPPKKR
jgi:probable rRNA maturation factor